MHEQVVIICECGGGYDLCDKCFGSGVVIIHKDEDYKSNRKNKSKKEKQDVTDKLTIEEKIGLYIKQDDALLLFIVKSDKEKAIYKAIERLENRLTLWKKGQLKIVNKELKDSINEYIEELNGKVEIIKNEYSRGYKYYKVKKKRKL